MSAPLPMRRLYFGKDDPDWTWQTYGYEDTPSRRLVRGIASTPAPDRGGDIVEPLGAIIAREIPLLYEHQTDRPIGVARLRATAAGLEYEAEIPVIPDPGPVKDDTDRIWTLLKHGLIRGASIGFKPLHGAIEILKTGTRYLKYEILELSLVTVPKHQEATAVAVLKSMRGTMTIPEQIRQFEQARAQTVDEMTKIMARPTELGETLDQRESDEYDALATKEKSFANTIDRLRQHEQMLLASATPITASTPAMAAAERGGDPSPVPRLELASASPLVRVRSNLPKGTSFIRYCQAMVVGRGDSLRAINFAQQWRDSTPEVEMVIKAAVAAGTTTDAAWAGPLVKLKPLASEFLELLRPATVLGRIPGLHKVPFDITVPVQTGGGTYAWVGEGAPKPVGSLAFTEVTLGHSKCAGIIVITEELARLSSPSAEETIRRDMIAGMAYFLDVAFTDPTKAAVANVSPASITNGVTPITSAGTGGAAARQDIIALLRAITAAGLSASRVVILMSEANALALGTALNPLGQPYYPGLGVTGGSAQGMTVITSQLVGANIIALVPDAIFLADDGGVSIDVSREASVQMDSAPMNPPDATVVLRSLWQENKVGLRSEQFINWKVVRTGAVQYTVQTYVGGAMADEPAATAEKKARA